MSSLLQIDDLAISFATDDGVKNVVHGVSFAVNRGEMVGLVGESGSGKTVTGLSVLRLLPTPPGRIDRGRILFNNKDILSLPAADLASVRGRHIGMIFQDSFVALSPLLTIEKQLVQAWRFHNQCSRKEARDVAATWLGKVGIPDVAERLQCYPFQLSGGMRQRVMIAMTLMLDPDLVIADEPTTALDVTIQAQILELMLEMKKEQTAILLITHDLGVVWQVCSRLLVMYAGRIVETGLTRDVLAAPLHPYTDMLLRSLPACTKPGQRLGVNERRDSTLTANGGCPFCDRCSRVMEKDPVSRALCRDKMPPLREIAPGRCVACWWF